MAKKATITPVTDTVNNAAAINTQLNAINNQLDNTLSLDGSVPNAMGADLDMNSNDLLNVGTLQTNDITVAGGSLTGVLASTGANKDAAAASAVDAAASAVDAAASASAVDEQYNFINSTPFSAGGFTKVYDPENLTVHTGPLLYDSTESRVWMVYSEAYAHAPTFGMSVYAEYSDGGGVFVGKRSIYAGRADRKVLATCGMWIDGRLLVVVNTEDAGGTRYLDSVYSDDGGSTWSTASISIPSATNQFLYGMMQSRPTAAGGDDTLGAIFYTYTNGKISAFSTANKGGAWTEISVADTTTAIDYPVGTPTTGFTLTEMTVAPAPSGGFIHYIRAANTDNMICATSTDMVTLVGLRDALIDNETPTLEVGRPPHLISYQGKIWLADFTRENWDDNNPELEQALRFFVQDGDSLYAAGGVFTNLTPSAYFDMPSRGVGMMQHVAVNDGLLAVIRAGETVFANNTHPATSQAYLLSSKKIPSNSLKVRDNLAINADFTNESAGTSFTGVTVNNTTIMEGWEAFASGGTLAFALEDVASEISNNLPHRPSKAMRITGGTDDFSGFQQTFEGVDAVRKFSAGEITATLVGLGALPSGLRFVVLIDYGTGGSADEVLSTSFSVGVNASTRVSTSSATVRTPILAAQTITSDAKVTLKIDKSSTDAWNFAVCGVKFETGIGATLLRPVRQPHIKKFLTSAGALMDSELTSIASVKALDQGVATIDSPTFAGVTAAGINVAGVTVTGGTVDANGSVMSGLRVTIADDAVAALTFTNRRFGMLSLTEGDNDASFPDANVTFLGYVDFGGSGLVTSAITGASVELNTAVALTGTTGTDTKLTIGVGGTDGTLYIENRRGATKVINLVLL